MSINKIELNNVLVANLYPSTLINEAEKYEAKKDNKTDINTNNALKYLGNNKKNILIAVQNKEFTHLPDKDLSFLGNILTACKLSLDDIALINQYNYPDATYKDFIEKFQSEKIILMNIEPTSIGLPISFPHFQIQAFSNVSYLIAPALAELENDQKLKASFWASLKKLFNL